MITIGYTAKGREGVTKKQKVIMWYLNRPKQQTTSSSITNYFLGSFNITWFLKKSASRKYLSVCCWLMICMTVCAIELYKDKKKSKQEDNNDLQHKVPWIQMFENKFIQVISSGLLNFTTVSHMLLNTNNQREKKSEMYTIWSDIRTN